ncbi:hypothetical protein PVAP13_7NG367200 [Panicum virgatum]|uniref:Uncharacterized protein n=1 Tax=Panicum virgatum TaxID=38727 RepID=A0A8T0QE20_PANVG|nr:hypothetical protein PVAP13_7NG367200 [Panicum virgatum]
MLHWATAQLAVLFIILRWLEMVTLQYSIVRREQFGTSIINHLPCVVSWYLQS